MHDDTAKDNTSYQTLTLLAELFTFYELEHINFALHDKAITHFQAHEQILPKGLKKSAPIPTFCTNIKPSIPRSAVTLNKEKAPSDKSLQAPTSSALRSPKFMPIRQSERILLEKSTDALVNATNLEQLQKIVENIDLFPLKSFSKNSCFFDGQPGKSVMFIEDDPNQEDEKAGTLFSGPAGILFNEMLFSIGLTRQDVYLASYLPWSNITQRQFLPFEEKILQILLARHIILAQPKFIISMGSQVTKALKAPLTFLGAQNKWFQYENLTLPDFLAPYEAGLTVENKLLFMPIFSPKYLLKNNRQKKHSWKGLLLLKDAITNCIS